MGFLSDIFESIGGKLHFMVFLGDAPAAEIHLEGKSIIVEIIHPLVALELGLQEFLKKDGPYDVGLLNKLKKMGYKIKIKYKIFEVDI